MTKITADLIKQLREKTGAGMMDCKRALVEVSGNFDEAVSYLRKKGHAAASKRVGRFAAEGIAALIVKGNHDAAIVEVNCETDFVARNDNFQKLVNDLRNMSLEFDSAEDLVKANYSGTNKTVEEEIVHVISVIGENVSLRRAQRFHVHRGVIGSYVHNTLMENGGKIAVLVALESELSTEVLQPLAKQLAMHVAAAKPEFLNIEDIDDELLKNEESIFREQAKLTGKPDHVIDKMIGGKMQKYYQEVVFLEQQFIMDNKTKISEMLKEFEKQHNGKVEIKDFARYQVGEGM